MVVGCFKHGALGVTYMYAGWSVGGLRKTSRARLAVGMLAKEGSLGVTHMYVAWSVGSLHGEPTPLLVPEVL